MAPISPLWPRAADRHCILDWFSQLRPDINLPLAHEHGPTTAHRLDQVVWQGWNVPVAPLDLQLSVAERRWSHRIGC